MLNEFRVNDLITIKLENGQTNIYLDNIIFHQCKFLFLEIPVDKVSSFDEINSIDEAVEVLDNSMETTTINLPTDVEFWAHCSNLQVWAENDYNTALLHSNLSFPLLKKLYKLGDPIAKKCFKEEVAKRLASGYVPVVHYLLVEGYLEGFDKLELEVIFQQLESFLTTIEKKKKLDFDEKLLEILINLAKLKFSKAMKLLNKIIINTFNLGDPEQFLILMGFEPLRYLRYGDIYWDFMSSASIYFFDNLYQVSKLDLNRVYNEIPASEGFEDFEDFEGSADFEVLENVIYLAEQALESLNEMPQRYFIQFLRNLVSTSPHHFVLKFNLLDLISEDKYYLDDVRVVLNDNWPKFKSLFVKVKDKFFYVNRVNKSLVLKNLDISSISEIDSLDRFSFVEVLDLSNNNISTIPNLDKFSRLKELNLSNNNITSIPNLDKLSKLKELNLSFNQIESVKSIGSLPVLESLMLRGNKISQLEEFKRFSNLKRLDLENNRITNLDGLCQLEKLDFLDLSENRIQTVPKLTNIRKIYKLILSKNLISRIDFFDFENLKTLKYLSLFDNKIDSIEGFKQLKELPILERIDIRNNPICKKPTSIPKKYKNLFRV